MEVANPWVDDVGKRVKGRKHLVVVDTLGLLLAVVVLQDQDGACWPGRRAVSRACG